MGASVRIANYSPMRALRISKADLIQHSREVCAVPQEIKFRETGREAIRAIARCDEGVSYKIEKEEEEMRKKKIAQNEEKEKVGAFCNPFTLIFLTAKTQYIPILYL